LFGEDYTENQWKDGGRILVIQRTKDKEEERKTDLGKPRTLKVEKKTSQLE
jgi:hypothetical protein